MTVNPGARTFSYSNSSYGGCACIAAALLLLWQSPSHAANFYVDNAVPTSGNGTSWSSAWKNFSNIVWSSLKPGDTLYISGGTSSKTYYETLTVAASGSSAGTITIRNGIDSGHNGKVVIDGYNKLAYGVYLNGRNYINVSNLSVRNHSEAGIRVQYAIAGVIIENNDIYSGDPGGGNSRGIDVRSSKGTVPVLVRYNCFTTPGNTYAQTDGIWSYANDGVIFEHNWIVISNSDTSGHSDGIQSYMDYNIVIDRNWFEQANTARTDNHGIWVTNIRSGATIKITNNVVLTPNLTGDAALSHYNESSWTENGKVQIWNNTVYGGQRAIQLYRSPYPEVKNNIICPSTGGFGYVVTQSTVPAANIDYNLIGCTGSYVAYANSSNTSWSQWRGSLGYDKNSINADPQFTNPSGKQLMPKSTSPAINRGATLSAVTVDINKTPRPKGPAYDIGAYEYIQ